MPSKPSDYMPKGLSTLHTYGAGRQGAKKSDNPTPNTPTDVGMKDMSIVKGGRREK